MKHKTILISKFPVELHRALKVYAAKSDRAMADLIVEAVEKYLEARPL